MIKYRYTFNNKNIVEIFRKMSFDFELNNSNDNIIIFDWILNDRIQIYFDITYDQNIVTLQALLTWQ